MRVLHFIDTCVSTADNQVFDYLPNLLRELYEDEKIIVIAPKGTYGIQNCDEIELRRYKSSAWFYPFNRRLFSRILIEIKPSIVHIHGCLSLQSSLFMKMCEKHNIPVLLTTGKRFSPWHVREGLMAKHILRYLFYQHHMLREACAIHVLNWQENRTLMNIGLLPAFKSKKSVNGNVSVVHNYNVKPDMSVVTMAQNMLRLYGKVADSNPFMLMSENDCRCEDLLLCAGIASEGLDFIITEANIALLSSLRQESIRYIILHSKDEGIYHYVVKGAERFGLTLPVIETETLERFKSHYACMPVEPGEDSFIMEQINDDETLTSAERDVCKAIINTWRKYRRRCLSRADMASLYRLLRFTDYDEVVLSHALKRIRYQKRAARLLDVLGKRYGLDEGFMFMPPLNDKVTTRMRRKLYLRGTE